MHMSDSYLEIPSRPNSDTSGKRSFGTIDPDYISVPDAKKLKLLEEKGKETLCERVLKVVEKEFDKETAVTEEQVEDIDRKLLMVQQYMYTLRYLGAVQYFSLEGVKVNASNSCKPKKLLQDNHPAVRRYYKCSSAPTELPTSKRLSQNHQIAKDLASERVPLPSEKNDGEEHPADRKIIPKQPESREVISQGRKGRFQKKMRIIVGNTYQYLEDAHENGNQLRFKWRIYVRGPSEYQDISNFVSSVTFTLDKSYSPHDVITISEFPFSVSRRGWGEFKVYLELKFHDPRNKHVKLLHSLRLSRKDDPLALTGIWRLGEETWYDLWLHDKTDDQTDELMRSTPGAAEKHAKEIIDILGNSAARIETIYNDAEGNFTLLHNAEVTEVDRSKEKAANRDGWLPETTNLDLIHKRSLQETKSSDCHVVELSDLVPALCQSRETEDNPESDLMLSREIEGDSISSLIPSTQMVSKMVPDHLSELENDNELVTNLIQLREKKNEAVPSVIPTRQSRSKMTTNHVSLEEKGSEMKAALNPSVKKDSDILPTLISSEVKEDEMAPFHIPSRENKDEMIPALIPSREMEDEMMPALIPSQEKENEMVHVVIPYKAKDSKMIPAVILSRAEESEMIPAVIPSRAEESEMVPALIPSRDENKISEPGRSYVTFSENKLSPKTESNKSFTESVVSTETDINAGPSDTVRSIQKTVSENIEDKRNTNLCKILIRQADGKLVSCMVPKEMYEMAVKLSGKNIKSSAKKLQQTVESTFGNTGQTNNIPALNGDTIPALKKVVHSPVNKTAVPMALNPPKIIFKPNSCSVASIIRTPLIRMKTPNGLTNINQVPIKQLPKGVTLRLSQVRVQARPNSFRVSDPPVNIASNNSDNAATSAIVLRSDSVTMTTTSSSNTRLFHTADGNKLLISPVSNQKVIATSVNSAVPNVKQIIAGSQFHSTAVPISNQVLNSTSPVLLSNSKLLYKIPSSSLGSVTSVLPGQIKSTTFPLISSFNSPSVIPCDSKPTIISIKPSDNSASSCQNILTSPARKIFITAPPQLVKINEAAVKTQFNNLKSVVVQQKLTTKQRRKNVIQKNLTEEKRAEISVQQQLEERKKLLKALSASCTSAEEVVRIYMKELPMCRTEECSRFSLCEVSAEQFQSLPLGRQRAIEFWRARQIRRELITLNLPNREIWNVKKIVSWARRHGFTPLTSKEFLRKDSVKSEWDSRNKFCEVLSLTTIDDLESNNGKRDVTKVSPETNSRDSIIMVDIEDEEGGKGVRETKRKAEAAVVRETEEALYVPYSSDGCDFVKLTLSQVRLKLHDELAVPGVKMELAKIVMWEATLSFMEDLLRSSYAAALDEKFMVNTDKQVHCDDAASLTTTRKSESPLGDFNTTHKLLMPPDVEARHVHKTLIKGRPEFQLCSGYGLGKIIGEKALRPSLK